MKLLCSTPGKIGNLTIKNRFVRSATMEAMATEDGHATEQHIQLYRRLAEGGSGLIITGHTWVQKNGQSGRFQMGIDDDKYIPALAKIADVIHVSGQGAKAVLQLTHAGRQTLDFQTDPVAASAVKDTFTGCMPRALTTQEVKDTIIAFADGARRARDAGFDAVQIHAAHGWLVSGFLSAYTNRRTDEYGGGSRENRCRMLLEIYDAIRARVGADFPILVKINVDDFLVGGITPTEAAEIARLLAKKGFAAIETSGGMWECLSRTEAELGWKPVFIPESRTGIKPLKNEAYFRAPAALIKKSTGIPVILVGGLRSLDTIESVLKSGDADFISLSRPLIREPDLPNKWLQGKRTTAECISCNNCLESLKGGGLRCLKKDEKRSSCS